MILANGGVTCNKVETEAHRASFSCVPMATEACLQKQSVWNDTSLHQASSSERISHTPTLLYMENCLFIFKHKQIYFKSLKKFKIKISR